MRIRCFGTLGLLAVLVVWACGAGYAAEPPSGLFPSLLYTSEDQHKILRFDETGAVVWELKTEDVPTLGIRWFAGLQVLSNGNFFICNAGGRVPFAKMGFWFRVSRF